MISRRVAIATGALAFANGWQSTASAQGVSDGQIRLPDGRRLGFRRSGVSGGPVVLYFHGLPGCRLEAGLIESEACRAGVELIAVDRPGMGRSTYAACRTIPGWSEDIRCLANCLGLPAFNVLGMSGGAPYALSCARFLSDRIQRVAVVSGHAPLAGVNIQPPGSQEHVIRFAARRPRLARFAFELVRKRLDRRPNRALRRLTAGWSECDRRLIFSSHRLRNMFLADIREAIRCGTRGVVKETELLTGCWGFRLCDITGVPVTIWHGACDPMTPPAMGRYFHRQIPGSQLFLQPGGGHITTLKCNATAVFQTLACSA